MTHCHCTLSTLRQKNRKDEAAVRLRGMRLQKRAQSQPRAALSVPRHCPAANLVVGVVGVRRREYCIVDLGGSIPHADTRISHGASQQLVPASTGTDLPIALRRIHTKEKPFRCDEVDCNYSTSESGALVRHLNRHAGIKKHKCPHTGCGVFKHMYIIRPACLRLPIR